MIVTIGRQHGSNGHLIAKALADGLGCPCYDKEIVDHAAEKSGYSRDVLHSYDEKRVSPYVITGHNYMGVHEGFRLNMQAASAQFDAIRALAEKGDGVFVGRCADYVLRKREDLVRVYIMADEAFRIQTMMERRSLNADQARKLIKEVDKDRSSYYRYYTDQDWGDMVNYDLCINSGHIGVSGAVQVIRAYIENRN